SACVEADITGTFTVILKHQPGVKSATSDTQDGGTDIDLTFALNVNDQADAPGCENEEEIITDVILTWTSESDTVVARAQDPDGEGPLDLEILDDIVLLENTTYTLSIMVENSIEGENITDEIMEESDEHMFFFAFTEGIFSDPSGDGNVDSRGDSVHYLDFDANELPVGLSTQWSTQTAMGNGTFRIVLKHQPEVKSGSSTIDDGGTDIDLTFNLGSIPTAIRDFIAPSDQLEIRPNPVVDYLEWNFKEGIEREVGQIQILDLYGRSLMQIDPKEYMVNTGQLPAGQYVLKICGRDKIWIKRFVK
ncbi:MAG: T9SS type A sorting domain-containing protein, partial [Saprospiraceae bacterium]|nr:T9SS type A sorting domain-containing protein [Saprospiraceae bacterium]